MTRRRDAGVRALLALALAGCSGTPPPVEEPTPVEVSPVVVPAPAGPAPSVPQEVSGPATSSRDPAAVDLEIHGTTIRVAVDADGRVLGRDGSPVADDALQRAVREASESRGELSVVLAVDARVVYARIVELIDLLREAGAPEFFLTRAP